MSATFVGSAVVSTAAVGLAHPDPMNRFALRARAVPAPVRGLVALGPLLATAYWCLDYAGPYRWLAEVQLDASGSYDVVLTGVIVALGALLPAAAAIQILATFYLKNQPPVDLAQAAAEGLRSDARIISNLGYIIAAVAFLGFGGTGAYFLTSALTAGEPVALAVAHLERGLPAGSRQVTLAGKLRQNDALHMVEENGSTSIEKVYIPVVSDKLARNSPPVVYLEAHSSWLKMYEKELASGTYPGMLVENGLPGLLRADLEDKGLLPKGPHWVLRYRASAEEDLTLAEVFGFCAGVVLFITALVAFVQSRRRRAAPPPPPPPPPFAPWGPPPPGYRGW